MSNKWDLHKTLGKQTLFIKLKHDIAWNSGGAEIPLSIIAVEFKGAEY